MERYRFVWNDLYSVGDDGIDSQHKQILEAINDLITAKSEGSAHAAIKTILDRLSYSMFSHLRHEEQLMRESKFPEFAQHKALHDQFWETARELPEFVHLPTAHNLLCFFKEWWLMHIQDHDKKYTPYLLQAGSNKKKSHETIHG